MDEKKISDLKIPIPESLRFMSAFEHPQEPMRVLMTGHMGFVGLETMKYLTARGIKVIGYDVMAGKDVRDIMQLDRTINEFGADRILHLAAIARFSDADVNPLLAHETNVLGTANITAIAKKYHVPLIYASTGSVYMPISEEPPITENFLAKGNSIYGVTKLLGETYVQTHIPYIILRYAHLFGPEKRYHGLIGSVLDRISRGLSPLLYGGKQSNDFTYIKDVARANYLALIASWDKWNQIYNIGTGEEITAEEATDIICKMTGYKGKVEKKPMRNVDPQRFVFDCSKAKNYLGYMPEYTFRGGLEDMFRQMGILKNEKSVPKLVGESKDRKGN